MMYCNAVVLSCISFNEMKAVIRCCVSFICSMRGMSRSAYIYFLSLPETYYNVSLH